MEAVQPAKVKRLARAEAAKDRRRNKRVELALGGRFLMDGADDHSFIVVNISCGGAAFRADLKPPVGAKIVCYLDDLGRLEAEVVRPTDDGFAVRFLSTAHKLGKIADRLTWLCNYKQLGLSDERVAPRHADGGPALVTRADGRIIQCRTIDISLSGAAFTADGPAPHVGEIVTVGNLTGEVVRTLRNGFAIRYMRGHEKR
jgi:hypothetical protein